MKLTPWFSGDQKPVRPGVYERDNTESMPGRVLPVHASYWDGIYWYAGCWTADMALIAWEFYEVSHYQSLPWRGILRNGK